MPVSLPVFVDKWKVSSLSELQSAQTHFNELCELLGEPNPTDADPPGEFFCFNKALTKNYGGKGFADVWKRGYFAWEYKGKHKDLKAAYKQINDYREDLLNPPLLVVCDTNLFQIHTNFQNTAKRVYEFNLDDLGKNRVTAKCPLPPLDVLRALFSDYNVLRPDRTDAFVTQEAARLFGKLAERLEIEQKLSATPQQIANFLIRILFCIFADAIGLLPDHLFRKLLDLDRFYPRRFLLKLPQLFAAMSAPDGIFGIHNIRYFNGGLFDPAHTDDLATVQLDKQDMAVLHNVAIDYNWAHVAPAIFGTLFERSLNKERRSLIGAHYTGEDDILLLIEPVVMRPLRQRWEDTKAAVLQTLTKPVILSEAAERNKTVILSEGAAAVEGPAVPPIPRPTPTLLHSNPEAERLLAAFFDHLSTVRILDPACGSGNFLYVALRRLLDLWLEARDFAAGHNIQLMQQYALTHLPSPRQLLGIEVDDYAHRLASIVVWIGFLQWKHEHAVNEDQDPILDPLSTIEHNDAILRYDAEGKPYEPAWPAADFIVSNPPFLGDKKMRAELNIEPHPRYVDDLRALYAGRVPGGADLVTYWFEKARAVIETRATRAGLLATNSISMVGNRPVLERIAKSGNIFMAWSDRPWVLAGAAVRVSMIGFDNGEEPDHVLDGLPVEQIHADLTGESNVASAVQLRENEGLCFLGIMKGGPFDITAEEARKMLARPVNPNGRPNGDVVKRRLGGRDITSRDSGGWIIDFDVLSQKEAALYEWPFEYVKQKVKPLRDVNRDLFMQTNWWRHGRSRPDLRRALTGLGRCIVTPEVAKHRLFVWMDTSVIPDHTCHVIARADDYFFGLLHSTVHELWSLSIGSTLEDRPRYTSDSTFDTFSFPWPPTDEPTSGPDLARKEAIAAAARHLVQLRDHWLNPPDTPEADLKKRTLTNLYNARPTWLADAHRVLDEAVFAAYGWPPNLSTPEILSRLLALNHARAAAQTTETPTRRRRTSGQSEPTPVPAKDQTPGDLSA